MPGPDPNHWLHRLTPREWISSALGELARAESAFAQRDRRGAIACCRRAAGMALNGMLALAPEPDARYGRSYMDHVGALADDESAPEAARDAARALIHAPMPGGEVVALRTASADEKLLEAARTVMAHAYAAVVRAEA